MGSIKMESASACAVITVAESECASGRLCFCRVNELGFVLGFLAMRGCVVVQGF